MCYTNSLLIYYFFICLSSESTIFQPAVEMDFTDSNQPDRQYWNNPIELELTQFQVLKAVPLDTAHLQDMDTALNALVADIGPPLDRVCHDLHCIKAQITIDLIYLYFVNTLVE